MNEKSTETYTDISSFQEIFKKFSEGQSYIKTQKFRMKVDFIGYSEGIVTIKIPKIKSIPESCWFYTRDTNDKTIISIIKFIKKEQDDLFLFRPTKIQIVTSTRTEERKKIGLDSKNGNIKQAIYISNIMTDFIIKDNLSVNKKKTQNIKDIVQTKLGKAFNHINIYFVHEGLNERMKYFREDISPIFIENLKDINQDKNENGHVINNYVNNIYPEDNFLMKSPEFISEISVPILFKTKIPYGFIQVNNTSPLKESHLSVIKKMAISLEEVLQKKDVFVQSEEKLPVWDVSKGGISIVFKEKRLFKFFKENSLIYFDLFLPENKKSNILSIVRNISSIGSSAFKIGCKIKEIDALSEVYYDEFLETTGIDVN